MTETRTIIIDSGKEYKFVKDTVNYSKAANNAVTIHNGTLAQFETEAEANAFWAKEGGWFAAHFDQSGDSEIDNVPFLWLGANNSSGTWSWNLDLGDGKAFNYNKWGTGSSNDGNAAALAIALKDSPSDSTDDHKIWDAGKWNALDTSTELYYLVELDESLGLPSYREVIYTFTETGETKTLAEMVADGWINLLEANYGDKYVYPAIYSNGIGGNSNRGVLDLSLSSPYEWPAIYKAKDDQGSAVNQVLDMSAGDEVLGWTVSINENSGSENEIKTEDLIYTNTSGETKTYDEMLNDNWLPITGASGDEHVGWTVAFKGLGDDATIMGNFIGVGEANTEITGIIRATDPNGLTNGNYFTVSTEADNGTATITNTTKVTDLTDSWSWSYTPDFNYEGSDQFTVTVTDDLGGTTTQNVYLTVELSESGVSTEVYESFLNTLNSNESLDVIDTGDVIYTNNATGETRVFGEMIDAGWSDMSGGNWKDPALYSAGVNGVHRVLDMSPPAPIGSSEEQLAAFRNAGWRWEEVAGWQVSRADELTGQQTFNLDVDGNGTVGAFTDGFMILRKMFGDAFPGEYLTSKVLPSDATRTTEQIHEYIQYGMDTGALDVDGNGEVGAFTDGFMVLRKMFGDAFPGEYLTSKVLPVNAERDTDQIHSYIESLMIDTIA